MAASSFFFTPRQSICRHFEDLIDGEAQDSSMKDKISLVPLSMDEGFFYPSERILVVSDMDIFSVKKTRTAKRANMALDFLPRNLPFSRKGILSSILVTDWEDISD